MKVELDGNCLRLVAQDVKEAGLLRSWENGLRFQCDEAGNCFAYLDYDIKIDFEKRKG